MLACIISTLLHTYTNMHSIICMHININRLTSYYSVCVIVKSRYLAIPANHLYMLDFTFRQTPKLMQILILMLPSLVLDVHAISTMNRISFHFSLFMSHSLITGIVKVVYRMKVSSASTYSGHIASSYILMSECLVICSDHLVGVLPFVFKEPLCLTLEGFGNTHLSIREQDRTCVWLEDGRVKPMRDNISVFDYNM